MVMENGTPISSKTIIRVREQTTALVRSSSRVGRLQSGTTEWDSRVGRVEWDYRCARVGQSSGTVGRVEWDSRVGRGSSGTTGGVGQSSGTVEWDGSSGDRRAHICVLESCPRDRPGIGESVGGVHRGGYRGSIGGRRKDLRSQVELDELGLWCKRGGA
jgi:hypothetical protein